MNSNKNKTHQRLQDHSDHSNESFPPLEVDSSAEKKPLNEVIDMIPVGLFHYRLLFICGLAFMADGLEVSLLSFMSACAGIEWGLSDDQIALISSIVFAGQFAGTLFFGYFADRFGRRIGFLLCCMLVSGAGLASGVSFSYWFLITCRAIVGFGVGGAVVPFDLLAEFLPNKYRGTFLIYIEGFWTLGSMFVAGVAWLMLSSGGWRLLTIITAIPVTISSLVAVVLLPESPRWSISQGRAKEATDTLRYAAKVNGVVLPPFRLDEAAIMEEEKKPEPSIVDFLTGDKKSLMIPLWTVWACFGFTYYGVILMVARVFQTGEGEEAMDATDEYTAGECSFNYEAIFVSSTSELVGVVVTGVMIDSWGRVGTQASLYAGAGIAVFFMGVKLPIIALASVSFFGRLTAFGANAATWVTTPELFTTECRGTGHSVANAMARMGAFFAPFLVENHKLPIVVVGCVLAIVNAVATVATLQLPETLGKDMDAI